MERAVGRENTFMKEFELAEKQKQKKRTQQSEQNVGWVNTNVTIKTEWDRRNNREVGTQGMTYHLHNTNTFMYL